MPSRDVNAVTRLAEASWWRDNSCNVVVASLLQMFFRMQISFLAYCLLQTCSILCATAKLAVQFLAHFLHIFSNYI